MKIKEMQEQIFKLIEMYLRGNLVNGGKTDYHLDALIIAKNNNRYTVKINQQDYENVRARTNMTFNVDDRVSILVANGDFSKKIIDDYIIE